MKGQSYISMNQQAPRKRGRPTQKAPSPDLYTFSEAVKRSGLPKSTFSHMVKTNKIPKVKPKGRTQGYYEKKFIDQIALDLSIFAIQYTLTEPIEFGPATEDDIPGIYDVTLSLWGSAVTTPVELRKSWYQKNPYIDFVVRRNGIVAGYFNMMPFTPEALEANMNGTKRGWQIVPEDIRAFEPGNVYDIAVGIATRGDLELPQKRKFGARLLAGVITEFEKFAEQGIFFRKLYATSREKDGIKMCQDLGFQQVTKEGDLFGRYELNLETSSSPFAQRYRAIVKKAKAKK